MMDGQELESTEHLRDLSSVWAQRLLGSVGGKGSSRRNEGLEAFDILQNGFMGTWLEISTGC